MLRITPTQNGDSRLLKLEGSIRGPWVGELAKAWQVISTGFKANSVKVELSGVSFADWEGRKLLLDMQREGARLVAPSVFLRHMLAEQVKSATAGKIAAEGDTR